MLLFQRLTPIVKYLFLLLTIVFFVSSIRNSLGNITEITDLLDTKKYNEVQLEENYIMLTEKWGEWVLTDSTGTGFTIKYVDIRSALFSGLMITFSILTITSLVLFFVIGKFLFPTIVKHYEGQNEQLVDLSTLRTAEQINIMVDKKEKNKKTKKEWF